MNYVYEESITIDSLEIKCELLLKVKKEQAPNESVIEILDIRNTEAYNDYTCKDQVLNEIELEIAKEQIIEFIDIDDVIEQGNEIGVSSFDEI